MATDLRQIFNFKVTASASLYAPTYPELIAQFPANESQEQSGHHLINEHPH